MKALVVKEFIWKSLMSIVIAIMSYHLFYLSKDLHSYLSKSSVSAALYPSFQIKEVSSECYKIKAHYTFLVQNKVIEGVCLFEKPLFINPYAAQKHVELWKTQSWKVFFNPKDPLDNTLQKIFPLNKLAQTTILIFLSIYFFCLRRYLIRLEEA